MRAHLVFAPLLLAFSAGCGAFRPPLTCPANGGRVWSETISQHFVLRTDVDAAEARTTLAEMERLHAALAAALARPPQVVEGRVDLVAFASADDYAAITGNHRTSLAHFTPQPDGDLEPQPTIVMHAGLERETRGTILHELTHRFLHERWSDVPPWLDEGLAQYYSTLEVEGNRAFVGAHGGNLTFVDERQSWADASTYRSDGISVSTIPAVREILTASRASFYAHAAEGGGPSFDDRRTQAVLYASSWKLAQFFVDGAEDTYRSRFTSFLAALDAGSRPTSAFSKAFEGVDFEAIDTAFHWFLTRGTSAQHPVSFRSAPPETTEGHTLSDAEVHLLWARTRQWTPDALDAIRKDIEEAARRDPGSPEPAYQEAVLAMRTRRFDAAARKLDAALAQRPEDPRYLLARSMVADHLAEQTRAEILDRLAKVARSAAQLAAVAEHDVAQGRADEALALSERAVRRDPHCWACQDVRALALLAKGRVDDALDAIHRAIALLPENAPIPGTVTAHLRRIEEAHTTRPAP
jgi:tetratricopeptide (TPR) repeat protein